MGLLSVLIAGVRRLPWRYSALIGLGQGIVFAALALATYGRAAPELVLLGAIGGGLAVHGFEHGDRARRRIYADMMAISSKLSTKHRPDALSQSPGAPTKRDQAT